MYSTKQGSETPRFLAPRLFIYYNYFDRIYIRHSIQVLGLITVTAVYELAEAGKIRLIWQNLQI